MTVTVHCLRGDVDAVYRAGRGSNSDISSETWHDNGSLGRRYGIARCGNLPRLLSLAAISHLKYLNQREYF